MNCTQAAKTLQAYLDGLLTQREATAVAAHLAACAGCSREVEFLRAVDAALSAEPTECPPAGLAPAIVRKALERRVLARRLVPRWLEALTFAGVAVGLAPVALLVLQVTGVFAGPRPDGAVILSALTLSVAGGLAAFGCVYYSAQV